MEIFKDKAHIDQQRKPRLGRTVFTFPDDVSYTFRIDVSKEGAIGTPGTEAGTCVKGQEKRSKLKKGSSKFR
jgi:hypothetical protein